MTEPIEKNELSDNEDSEKLKGVLTEPIEKNELSDNEDSKKLKGVLTEPIESAMNEVLTETMEGWIKNVASGDNHRFTRNYGKALERLKKDAEREWKSKYAIGSDLLNGLAMDFPSVTGVLPEIVNEDGCVGNINVLGMAAGVFFKKLFMLIAGVLSAILATWLVALVVASVTGGLLLTGAAATVVALFAGKKLVDVWGKCEDKIMSGITEKIRPKLAMVLRDEFKKNQDEIQNGMKETILKGILDELSERCREALRDQEAKFHENVKAQKAQKQKSQEEQDMEAEHAKKVRTEQIEPAKAEIAAFADGLKPYFE